MAALLSIINHRTDWPDNVLVGRDGGSRSIGALWWKGYVFHTLMQGVRWSKGIPPAHSSSGLDCGVVAILSYRIKSLPPSSSFTYQRYNDRNVPES